VGRSLPAHISRCSGRSGRAGALAWIEQDRPLRARADLLDDGGAFELLHHPLVVAGVARQDQEPRRESADSLVDLDGGGEAPDAVAALAHELELPLDAEALREPADLLVQLAKHELAAGAFRSLGSALRVRLGRHGPRLRDG